MISYEEALERILFECVKPPSALIPLEQLNGKILAEEVTSTHDLPLFNNSAVDGFGVLADSVVAASKENPIELSVLSTIKAGDNIETAITMKSVVRIFTGAPVPQGIEAVVMQEDTRLDKDNVYITKPVSRGENIRFKGEELRAGTSILSKSQLATPPVVGLLAALGYATFPAYPSPSIGIVVTGNELIAPGQSLLPGQLFESNSYGLFAALHSAGFTNIQTRKSKDDFNALKSTFSEILQESDVLLVTGGVSVGEYDLVKPCLQELGVETCFWKVAIKPGKPFYFGKRLNPETQKYQWIFGLPGNPVAVLVTYHQLVLPALKKLSGFPVEVKKSATARLTKSLRKKPGRLEWVRAIVNTAPNGDYDVTPTSKQDSHMLSGLAKANCLIVFPRESQSLEAGSDVEINCLNWSNGYGNQVYL